MRPVNALGPMLLISLELMDMNTRNGDAVDKGRDQREFGFAQRDFNPVRMASAFVGTALKLFVSIFLLFCCHDAMRPAEMRQLQWVQASERREIAERVFRENGDVVFFYRPVGVLVGRMCV